MPPELLTLRRLNRATLARQGLLARRPGGVVDALAALGALQAQEPKPPFLALWSRTEGFDAEALREALHARAAVRATLMRGTLHLTSAHHYAAQRPALQPTLTQATRVLGARADGLELDAVLPAARALVGEAPRTFGELRTELGRAFPTVDPRALGYAVRMHLPLVMVPTEDRWAFGRDARFALAEAWLGAPLAPATPHALVLAYLAAFGPAGAADAQAWSGLGGVAAVLDDLRPGLAAFRDERGRELFDLPAAPRPDEQAAAPPRLLAEFDSLVLAHDDRTRVIADEHRCALVTKNLRVRACFLIDGFVAGTWAVTRRRATATLTLAPFAALPGPARDELVGEAEALLRFAEPDAAVHAVAYADRP